MCGFFRWSTQSTFARPSSLHACGTPSIVSSNTRVPAIWLVTAHHSTVHHSTAQNIPVQYSRVEKSTVPARGRARCSSSWRSGMRVLEREQRSEDVGRNQSQTSCKSTRLVGVSHGCKLVP